MTLEQISFSLPRVTSAGVVGTGALRVGAAERELDPAVGYSLAGYSRMGKDGKGQSARKLRACALVTENPDGERHALVFLDLWAPSRVLLHGVAGQTAALGLGWDRVMLVGTHLHTGPGHYFGDRLYDAFAQRTIGFAPELARQLVGRIVDALRSAVDNLAPGRIGVGQARLWGVSVNRSLAAFQATPESQTWHAPGMPGEGAPPLDPSHAAVDPRVVAVVATDSAGVPVAAFSTFGCHATALGAGVASYDPDWPGVACGALRKDLAALNPDVVVAMAASAAGDGSPLEDATIWPWPALGPERAAHVGKEVAQAAASAVALARANAGATPVTMRAGEWTPGKAVGTTKRLPTGFYGKPTLAGSEESRTPAWFLFGPAYRENNPRAATGGPHGGKRVVDGFDEALLGATLEEMIPPDSLPVHVLELGGRRFVGLPGEATFAFARRLEETLGGPPTTVLHCSGGYLGYFTTPEEYARQHYEGASTYHGPRTFEHLAETCARIVGGAPLPTGEVRFVTWLRQGSAVGSTDGWLKITTTAEPEAVLQPSDRPPVGVYATRTAKDLVVGWITAPPERPDTVRLAAYDDEGMRIDAEVAVGVGALPGHPTHRQWTAVVALPTGVVPTRIAVLPTESWGAFGLELKGGEVLQPAAPAAYRALLTPAADPLGVLDLLAPALEPMKKEEAGEVLGYLLDPLAERRRFAEAVQHGFTFPGMDLARIPIDAASTKAQTAPWLPWAPDAAPALWLILGAPMPGFRSPKDAASDFRYDLPPRRADGSRRFALCADFGSGEYHSRYIAVQMERSDPDAVFHLGDVYYGGTDDEVAEGLVRPLAEDTRLLIDRPFWALPGNHELYSRGGDDGAWGGAWLKFVDGNRQAGRQRQEGSSFVLRGEGLTIVAPDTDWLGTGRLSDKDMRAWVDRWLHQARADGDVVILLTQNHPWHLLAGGRSALYKQDMRAWIEAGLVDLWFFGNKHYAALYNATDTCPVISSCIGHGGYAEKRVKARESWPAPQPVEWVELAPRFPEWTGVRPDRMNNGFVQLDLAATGRIDLRYIDWMGNLRCHAVCERVDGRYLVVSADPFELPAGP